MPTYEYECTACGHDLEVVQRMSDDRLTDCPVCKQAALRKKISASAFHLKGGGWYKTDFKDMGKQKATENKDVASTDKLPAEAKESAGAVKPTSDQGKETAVTETKPVNATPPANAA